MDEDRSLIQNILNGDIQAYKTIVDRHQRLVAHVVFKLVSNPSDQQEMCQDVFVKVYENLKSFKYESKLSTWIARIAYNTCLNYLQKKKVDLYEDAAMTHEDESSEGREMNFTENIWGGSIGPDEKLMHGELSGFLQEEIQTLPAQYKTILTLYHMDEMSYEEIGNILNLPEGTVKSYLFRARKMLKEKLLAKYKTEELLS
ncbi:sigma-70 family RNA polymerase sigma factor [bacterium]|nr:sigma-70 family RNA polymerase sigma factor [bacterium]